MTFTIRRLTDEDAADYRALRLEALRRAPEAFGESHEDAAGRDEAYWTGLFSDSANRAFFGADFGGRLLGAANFMRAGGTKQAHKSWLFGMFVDPEARGTGCAAGLVDAIVGHARQTDGVVQIHLGVAAENSRARRLYEKAGFMPYGTEPRGLKFGDRFIDEVFMVKFLDAD